MAFIGVSLFENGFDHQSKNIFMCTNLHRLFFLPNLNLKGMMVSVCMSPCNTKPYIYAFK